MSKIRIKLIGREWESEFYELSIKGEAARFRCMIPCEAIESGGKWHVLANHCNAYQNAISSPAVAYNA